MPSIFFDRHSMTAIDLQELPIHPEESEKPKPGESIVVIDGKVMRTETLRNIALIEAGKMVEEENATPQEINAYNIRNSNSAWVVPPPVFKCTSIEEAAKAILKNNLAFFQKYGKY